MTSAEGSSSWSAHEDGNGNTYYVNDSTGESAWELPDSTAAIATQGAVALVSSSGEVGLSPSWSVHDDGNGNTYYVNDSTGESAWELPKTTTATPQDGDLAASDRAGYNDQDADGWWGQEEEEEEGEQRAARNTGAHHCANNNDGNWGTDYGEGDQYWENNEYGGDNTNNPLFCGNTSNPFGGNYHETWPLTPTGEDAAAEDGYYGRSLELTQGGTRGGKGGGWSQEWDEGSQAYYWLNASSGESRW